MKTRIKRVMAIMLGCMVLVAGNSVTVKAVSQESGVLGTAAVQASVSISSSSATATTTCGRSATINVSATVYYHFGTGCYKTTASNSSSGGGTSATATKQLGGADVIGGKGVHYVAFESYSWNPTTTVGVVLD
ncbi:MAG: hypothetical protein MR016_01310 [Agathobacter sp.]|nr:hypothetical protein [Agathobacter sp.]